MPQGIEPSNLHKVFWPKAGLTKGDLLAYFDELAPCFLPTLRDRPLTVIRYPDGVEGGSFYQKNTPTYAPHWVRTIRLRGSRRAVTWRTPSATRSARSCGSPTRVRSSFTHSSRGSTGSIAPDYMLLDMDPPAGRFDLAVEAAFVARDVLAGLGLGAIPKTSGAKGVHVCVPIQRRYDYRRVQSAAERIAARIQQAAQDLATTEFKKAERGGRVLVDVARSAFGAHTAPSTLPTLCRRRRCRSRSPGRSSARYGQRTSRFEAFPYCSHAPATAGRS